MTEYPLLPIPEPQISDRPKISGGPNNLKKPGRHRQEQRLGPIFQRLQNVFDEDRDPLTLREDPSAIAPERALVFEVAGSIDGFARAVKKIPSLEYLGEEEMSYEPDEDFAYYETRKGRREQWRDDKPVDGRLYLAMPDIKALRQLLSLWNKYQSGQQPERGFKPWFDVFEQLHNLRPWGPLDRIPDDTVTYIKQELKAHSDSPIRLEVELWQSTAVRFKQAVKESNGKIKAQASIPQIAYEAMLIELPATQAYQLSRREEVTLAICDDIMWIRPQTTLSIPTGKEPLGPEKYVEPIALTKKQPIVALLDGMPVQNHQRLKGRIMIDDPDNFDAKSVVSERYHGTEMASLILHGDINRDEPVLQRPLYIRPILYAPGNKHPERFPRYHLPIDTIYRAVLRMKERDNEGGPTAKDVFIVNLSVCDPNRQFAGIISPWARLLDYLAEQFGILFIVSAGNITTRLKIPDCIKTKELEEKSPDDLTRSVLNALKEQQSQRTLLSPAEAVNVLTIGSWHDDSHNSYPSSINHTPYENGGPNISSSMGLGYLKTVKPDIFMPGGRERFRILPSRGKLEVEVVIPSDRLYGLKTAHPGEKGQLDKVGLTAGTSVAAALTTRAAHRIFDSLLDRGLLTNVDPNYYGVIIKALLVHRARWDDKLGQLVDMGIHANKNQHHSHYKDDLTRLFGYGLPNIEEAINCTPHRATLIGFGSIINVKQTHLYRVPLPNSLDNVREFRSVTLTLAWLSPVNIRRRDYRRAKLQIKPDEFNNKIKVQRVKPQPSHIAVERGTLFHVRYEGKRAAPFVDDGHMTFNVFCREQAGVIDKPVRYGLSVTIEAGEHIPVYQDVRERLAVGVRAED